MKKIDVVAELTKPLGIEKEESQGEAVVPERFVPQRTWTDWMRELNLILIDVDPFWPAFTGGILGASIAIAVARLVGVA